LYNFQDEWWALKGTFDRPGTPGRVTLILAILLFAAAVRISNDKKFPIILIAGLVCISAVVTASVVAWILIAVTTGIIAFFHHLLLWFSALVLCRSLYELKENAVIEVVGANIVRRFPLLESLGEKMRRT
jgi:hypothetical protein